MTAPAAVVAERVESIKSTMRSAQEMAEDEGLTFTGTPGPGYSEGGDVFDAMAPPGVRELSAAGAEGARSRLLPPQSACRHQ